MIRIAPLSAANLLILIAGFVIWSAAFSALYGVLSIGCEYGWPAIRVGPISLNTLALATTLAVHLALHVALVLWQWRRLQNAGDDRAARFLALASFGTGATSLIGTLWIGVLIAFLTQCAA